MPAKWEHAMDYSDAETLIEGRYRYLLMVRDLASGKQLLALPCDGETEATASAALRELFAQHGAPLILKVDNGSAFIADAFRALLAEAGVTALYSPPYTPEHNGACEAGNGGLRTRVRHLSAWAGRPGEWTCEDVERARCSGSDHGRPFGRRQPQRSIPTLPIPSAHCAPLVAVRRFHAGIRRVLRRASRPEVSGTRAR